jgi:hypothetical protein
MLNETPEAAGKRLAAQTRSLMRAASANALRERKTESQWRDDLGRRIQGFGSVAAAPPDPYAEATGRAPCPFDDLNYDPHGAPPDGYGIALAKKENQR